MKKRLLFLSTLLFLSLFYSCSPSAQTDNQTDEKANNEPKKEETDSKKESSNPSVICKNEEKPGEGEPILIKTCQYGKIQTKSEGYPDMKGRYSYSYEVKFDGKKVKNADIFNDKMPELLSILNDKILKDYTELYNAEDTKDCFEGMDKTPKFTIDQMGVEFNDNKIIFNVSFGLSDMCMSADGSTVSMTLDEIAPYLK